MAEQDVLKPQEAFRRLGLNKNTGYNAIKKGEIPSIRIGRCILIPRVAFERMLEPK